MRFFVPSRTIFPLSFCLADRWMKVIRNLHIAESINEVLHMTKETGCNQMKKAKNLCLNVIREIRET